MNTDEKILTKILAKRIQQYIFKKSFAMIKQALFLRCKFNNCQSINMIHHINKRKDKSHMILSVDTFDKVQHPTIIKTLNKVGLEGTYLNITKATYKYPIATSYSVMKTRAELFPHDQEQDKDVHFYSM